MPRYRLSSDADDDLVAIWTYVFERNPGAADALLREIDAACDRLVDFPFIGTACVQFGQGLRSWPVGRYIVFYQALESPVAIVRVLHGARDIEAILGDK